MTPTAGKAEERDPEIEAHARGSAHPSARRKILWYESRAGRCFGVSSPVRSAAGERGRNPKFSRDLDRALVQMNDMTQSIRALFDFPTKCPTSSIRGRGGWGRRKLVLALGVSVAGLAAGCASPSPTLYTLAPLPGPALGAPRRVILVREVSLARYLQRPGIVLSSADYRLDVSANDWWGEPLSAMLGRVLVADLTARLPASTVLAESVAITVDPDISVEVSIQRFDEDATGQVVLAAAFVLAGRRGASAPRTFKVTVPAGAGRAAAGTPSVAAQVAAMSAALAQLSDSIAVAIAALPGNGR